MASFAFFDSFTTAQTLADGEFGFIADTGSLRVSGDDAISATGIVVVAVHGRLSSSESAVDFNDGTLTLTVGETGRVSAVGEDTIAGNDLDQAYVSNAGSIRSSADALDLRGEGPIDILNTGTLFGRSDGIVTLADSPLGVLTRIENRGTITGDEDGGIDHLGGDTFILNRGTIEGVDYGFDAADPGNGDTPGEDEVRNFGSIEGGVFLYALSDFVLNRGTIDLVELGGGSDLYVARGTGSAESVDGGGGSDLLVSGRADDSFIGDLGGDIFLFERRGGDDRIEDFGGQDTIDLSDLGLSGFSELRPLIEDRPNGALIDLSEDGLTIFLAGVAKADLRARDFNFEDVMVL